jgi:uncharacterized integral membrane protein
MNWFILIPFGIAILILLVFLIIRNQKDEVKFEEQLKDDYHKPKNEGISTDIEEIVK